MSSFNNIGENVAEDSIDEVTSCIMNETLKLVFGDIQAKLANDDSCTGQMMESAISTFKFGIQFAVQTAITVYIMKVLVQGSGGVYLWLKASRMITNVTDFVSSKIGRKGGLSYSTMLQTVTKTVAPTEQERLLLANHANTNLNNLTSNITSERNNQIIYENGRRHRMDSLVNTSTKKGGVDYEKFKNVFDYKMKTGTWQIKDKKIFEGATGSKVRELEAESWAKLVTDLNSYSDFAKTAEGKAISLAQIQLDDLITRKVQSLKAL